MKHPSVLLAAVVFVSCHREFDKVVVSPRTAALTEAGATAGFKAEALDTGGHPMPDRTIAFTSSNPEVATVDRLGWVTAQRGGTATITASSGDKIDTATVDISYPARLLIDVGEQRFKVKRRTGEATAIQDRVRFPAVGAQVTVKGTVADELERPLGPAALVISSADETVIAVEKDGTTLTAHGYGRAIVTVSFEQYAEAFLAEVEPPASMVVQAPRAVTLKEGQAQLLPVRLVGIPGPLAKPSLLTFMSSDVGVVGVEPSGRLTAVHNGKAQVTVTAGQSKALVDVVVLGGAVRPKRP